MMNAQVHIFLDTSCSLFHVRNAGRIIGKSDRIPLNFSHGPLAYQGRTASIVPSGTPIKRPCGHFPDPEWSGQSGSQGQHPIVHGPSRKMDYEVELAAVIGKPHGMHQSLTPELAEEHVFGYILMNDWSGTWYVTFLSSSALMLCSSGHPGLRNAAPRPFQWQISGHLHLTMDCDHRCTPAFQDTGSSARPANISPPVHAEFDNIYNQY